MADRRAAERHGRRSEVLAALLLRLKLYRILGRRIRTPLGEIDLIARAPSGILCFVEVKARAQPAQVAEALGRRQRGRIVRAAELYLAARPGLAKKGIRFDVVSVTRRGIPRHLRDAWRVED